jgi:hypothetical protein
LPNPKFKNIYKYKFNVPVIEFTRQEGIHQLGSRKLSAVAAGHTMHVRERHYEKVGEDFEQVHESYRKYHPAFAEGW